MAISFSKVKKFIGLYDTLTFGKFVGIRLDSLIEDHYEYLIYLNKTGVKFSPEVLEILKNKFSAPTKDDNSYYIEPSYEEQQSSNYLADWYNDIPY